MCKKPTPIELETANGNSVWAPKLKKSFSCSKCKSYILARPVITKLPFTNPRIPVTYEIEIKKVLKSLGYIDMQIKEYSQALKPRWGKHWGGEDYESLLESPDNFAYGMKKCLDIKLSKSNIRAMSKLPIFNNTDKQETKDKDNIVDIHRSKPRSPRKKRQSILVPSPKNTASPKDPSKHDKYKNTKSNHDEIKINKAVEENPLSSYQITILSAAGLKRETISYVFVDIDNQIVHQSQHCKKSTTSPEYNNDFIIHVYDQQNMSMRVMANNGECLGVAKMDIVKHLKFLNIGDTPEMISLRLGDKLTNKWRQKKTLESEKAEQKEDSKPTSRNGILIITATKLEQTVKNDGRITAKPAETVYEIGDIIEFEHPSPMTFKAIKERQKEIQAGFKRIDKNNDGSLSPGEIIRGFKEIGLDLDDETLEKIIEQQDKDGDKTISFEEFLEYSDNGYISGVLMETNNTVNETTYDILGFDGKSYRVSPDQLRLTKDEEKKRRKELEEKRQRKIAEIKYNSMLSGAIVKVQDRQRIKNKKTKIKSLKSAVSSLIMSSKVKSIIQVKQETRFQVFKDAAEEGKKVLQRKADKSEWLTKTSEIINSRAFRDTGRKLEKKRVCKVKKLVDLDAVTEAKKRIMQKKQIVLRNHTWKHLHENIPHGLQQLYFNNHKKGMFKPVHKPLYNKERKIFEKIDPQKDSKTEKTEPVYVSILKTAMERNIRAENIKEKQEQLANLVRIIPKTIKARHKRRELYKEFATQFAEAGKLKLSKSQQEYETKIRNEFRASKLNTELKQVTEQKKRHAHKKQNTKKTFQKKVLAVAIEDAVRRLNIETVRAQKQKTARDTLEKISASKIELKQLSMEALERRNERNTQMTQRRRRSKVIAASAHSHNLKVKKRSAIIKEKVTALRRVSMRIPYAFQHREERITAITKNKAILKDFVFPHFQELQKLNNDFDNAVLDAKTGRRTSAIKSESIDKLFSETNVLNSADIELLQAPIVSSVSRTSQLDTTDLKTILNDKAIKYQAAITIQRKYRQHLSKDLLRRGKELTLQTGEKQLEHIQLKKFDEVNEKNKHLAQVDSSLTLDLDFENIASTGTPEREKYEHQIRTDFSNSLGINKERFKINDIKSGSVIIDFSILPCSDGSGMIAEEAANLLENQIKDPKSTLYTSPSIQILKTVNAVKSLAGGKLLTTMVLNSVAVAHAAKLLANGVANGMGAALKNITSITSGLASTPKTDVTKESTKPFKATPNITLTTSSKEQNETKAIKAKEIDLKNAKQKESIIQLKTNNTLPSESALQHDSEITELPPTQEQEKETIIQLPIDLETKHETALKTENQQNDSQQNDSITTIATTDKQEPMNALQHQSEQSTITPTLGKEKQIPTATSSRIPKATSHHSNNPDNNNDIDDGNIDESDIDNEHFFELCVLSELIDTIWSTYDVDGSNTISVDETKQLLLDITGHQSVSRKECEQFVKTLDTQGDVGGESDSVIEKEELIFFVDDSIHMDAKQREAFATRGSFQRTLMDFINGIEARLKNHTNEKMLLYNDFFEHMWSIYAKENKPEKTSEELATSFLLSYTKEQNISMEVVRSFIANVTTDEEGNQTPGSIKHVSKKQLSTYILRVLTINEDAKKQYGEQSDVHNIWVNLFDTINTKWKQFDMEAKAKAESDNKAARDGLNKPDNSVHSHESDIDNEHFFELCVLSELIDTIWSTYDVDGSNTISVDETKQLMLDITGHQSVSRKECEQFVKTLDTQGDVGCESDSVIEKEELIFFVDDSMRMDTKQREAFATRGSFQRTLMDFINGIEARLKNHTNEKMLLYNDFFEHMWSIYAKENEPEKTSEELATSFLLSYTKEQNISMEVVRSFIANVTTDEEGNQTPGSTKHVSKKHFSTYILRVLTIDEDAKKQYGEQSDVHKIWVNLFDTINTKWKQFDMEAKAKVESDNKAARDDLNTSDNSVYSHESDDSTINDTYKMAEVLAFVDVMWEKYDMDKSGGIDVMEMTRMIEDVTETHVILTEEMAKKFVDGVIGESKQNVKFILKDQLLDFIIDGVNMAQRDRDEYSKRSALHKVIVNFFDGIDKARVMFRHDKIKSIKSFLDHIWEIYDSDNNGYIDVNETKFMIEDLTGLKNVKSVDCDKLLASIDTNRNGKIDQEELSDFIFHGMLMSETQRLGYSKRGGLHETILLFFVGVDNAIKVFNEHGKDALDDYMKDMIDPDLKFNVVKSYVDKYLWDNYDKLRDDYIDVQSAMQMIKDVTKLKNVTVEQTKAIFTIDAKNSVLTRESFMQYINANKMTAKDREEYVTSPNYNKLSLQLIDGLIRESKIYREERKQEIELFLAEIWNIYDADNRGHLGSNEIKQMLEDLTDLNDLDKRSVDEFLMSIDEDKNGTIERDELANFICIGIAMSVEARREYGARSEMHNTIVQFFDGVDAAKGIFLEKGSEGLARYFVGRRNATRSKAPFEIGEAVKATTEGWDGWYYNGAIKSINPDAGTCLIVFEEDGEELVLPYAQIEKHAMHNFQLKTDLDQYLDYKLTEVVRGTAVKSGSSIIIDSPIFKRLLDSLLSPKTVSVANCKKVLNFIDRDGNATLNIAELSLFAITGIEMPMEQHTMYRARGEMQSIMCDAFEAIERDLKRFLDKQEGQEDLTSYVDSVWYLYDTKNTGTITKVDCEKMFKMFGLKKTITPKDFSLAYTTMLSHTSNGDNARNDASPLDKTEFIEFLSSGIFISDADRQVFYKTKIKNAAAIGILNELFQIVNTNRKIFKERNQFEKNMEDFMSHVFQKYDTADNSINNDVNTSHVYKGESKKTETHGDGTLDKHEWKKMLEVGFNLNVTLEECEKIIAKMDGDSDGTVDALEFATFINNMLRFTEDMRTSYANEDPVFHRKVLSVVDCIRTKLVQFTKENEELILEIEKQFLDKVDLDSSSDLDDPDEHKHTMWEIYGGGDTGEIDGPGFKCLIENFVRDRLKPTDKLALKKVKEFLQVRNENNVPLMSKQNVCKTISKGFSLPGIARNAMLHTGSEEDQMFNRIMLIFYDAVKTFVLESEEEHALPNVNDKCWVRNLSNRWHLRNCIYQGTYLGRLPAKEGYHEVQIFEDHEDLKNVAANEIVSFDDLKLEAGDMIHCCNNERNGWETDEVYEGKLIEFVAGGAIRMVVDFGDEVCNNIKVSEIYHVVKQTKT